MSAKFLHIPQMALTGKCDVKHFTDQDFLKLRPYLPTFLANIEDRQTFDAFLERFPDAMKTLNEKNGYDVALIIASRKNGPFMQYVLHHPPEGKTIHDMMQENEFWPVFCAIQSGQFDIIPSLMESITDEDYENYFINSPHLSGYLVGKAEDYNNVKRSIRAPEEATHIARFMRGLPKDIATRIIKGKNNHFLTDLLGCGALDEFEEFYNYLSLDDQKHFLANDDSLCEYCISSDAALNAFVRIVGKENIRAAFSKEFSSRSDSLDQLLGDEPVVSRAYKLLDTPLRENPDVFLECFPPDERDQLAVSNNFGLFHRMLQWDNPQGFRALYNALTPKHRDELFASKDTIMWFKTKAGLGSYEVFDGLDDILPASIKALATTRHAPYNYTPAPVYPPQDTIRDIYEAKKHPQFNAKLYERILPIITLADRVESGSGIYGIESEAELKAAKLAILFDDFNDVDRYLGSLAKGYGAGAIKNPVHDACLMEIPSEAFNTKHWARVVQHYGPAAARFLGSARKIEAYAQAHDLPLPEKPKEIADIAKHSFYKRMRERPAFAQVCMERGVTEEQFNRCLDVLENKATVRIGDTESSVILKSKSNIPDIIIDGDAIGYPGYCMRKLNLTQQVEQKMLDKMDGSDKPLTDAEIATILGELSHCCQSIGKSGEKFTLHGLTSENGDFYVWTKKLRDKPDHIVAQSWVWRADDEKNPHTLVFDSIEPLGAAHNHIFADFMLAFAEKAKEHGIAQVNIGTGGKTPQGLPFAKAEHPARLNTIDFENTGAEYDSKEQWRVQVKNEAPSDIQGQMP